MIYLVTGGAGFIGSHLVDELIRAGHSVRVLDNLSTGKKKNLNPRSTFILGDIRKPENILASCRGADGIFHTAALPNVQYSIENPVETNEINVSGTLNVLLAAKQTGVKRVIFSSTSAIYGDPISLPLPEDMKPNPKSPYALQKLVGEEYARLASLLWGLQTVSLRYFNVYGPRMASEGAYVTVIGIFNRQRLAGEPLTITGDGSQTRDFVYIDDVVRANILAMENFDLSKGEIINIGSGINYSVNHIATEIGGSTIHLPPRLEPHDTLADISCAKKLLNWSPKVNLSQGLKVTMQWYEQTRSDS